MARQKHKPQRTCVVCRQKMDKRSLNRVVVDPELGIMLDPTGKRNGRGAYLCSAHACWEQALTTDVLARALRTPLSGEDRARLHDLRPQ